MSGNPVAHVVQPGEHFDAICARVGADPEEVWGASENESLRAERDRDTLATGDIVYLPEPVEVRQTLECKATNSYRARVPTVPVQVRMRLGAEVVANEAFHIEGTQPLVEGTTDGDGLVDVELPATTRHAVLVIPGRQLRAQLRVGALEPQATGEGARERLRNLGFISPVRRAMTRQERAEELASALRAFQHDRGLSESGELDDETAQALQDRHGT